MPLWDFKCVKCGEIRTVFDQLISRKPKKPVCKHCGGRCVAVLSRGTNEGNERQFPLTLEHANIEGEGPLTFQSSDQLRRHCAKHKITSGALL